MPLHGHKDSDPFSRPLHESNLLRSIAISLHPLKDTPYDLGWLLSSIFNVTPFLLRNIHVPRGRPVAGAPGEQVAQVAKEYLDSHGAVDDDTPVQAGAMVAVEDIVALLKLLPYTDAFEDQRSEVMDAASAYECFLLDLESTDEQRRGAISALCLAAYTLRKWVEYRFRHLLWNAVVQVLYGGDKNCAQVRTMKEGMNEGMCNICLVWYNSKAF